jgi:hypothetical protein
MRNFRFEDVNTLEFNLLLIEFAFNLFILDLFILNFW